MPVRPIPNRFETDAMGMKSPAGRALTLGFRATWRGGLRPCLLTIELKGQFDGSAVFFDYLRALRAA